MRDSCLAFCPFFFVIEFEKTEGVDCFGSSGHGHRSVSKVVGLEKKNRNKNAAVILARDSREYMKGEDKVRVRSRLCQLHRQGAIETDKEIQQQQQLGLDIITQ